ncbi:protein TSSC4 [Lingula anatina]|uniref:U5 small nuclear ribonucleoprotein TSSC4 n=1 Tax=Lingula anatina TaxID=7574 RepID=A0A1S3GZC8_LINAN|nr:protein TSSC4 [Lingula anatina]|eukprot:XP_013379032.1 protein TSSC4 [Lingula anatina]
MSSSPDNKQSGFALNGVSTSFKNKSSDVFSCLNALEDKHHAYEKHRRRSDRAEDDKLLKSEPVVVEELRRPFKRPAPPRRFPVPAKRRGNRNIPDYRIHPEKWTRYDLDVPESQLSEASNTSAALSFLEERRKLRESSAKDSVSDEDYPGASKVPVFKKPAPSHLSDDTSHTFSSKPEFRGGKVVMPEYVIGEKPKPKTKLKQMDAAKPAASATLHLEHLEDSDKSITEESRPDSTKFKSRKQGKRSIRSRQHDDSD